MVIAIKLVLKEKTKLDVYYIDGIVKRYDVLFLAKKFPQLNALKDRNLFLKGKLLGWSVIQWNDELDISTEDPYYDGVDVSNEYDDIDNVVIGYKIKQKRLELEMSQMELSKIVGVDQSDLSKIEKGTYNATIKTLHKIVKGLKSKLNVDIK